MPSSSVDDQFRGSTVKKVRPCGTRPTAGLSRSDNTTGYSLPLARKIRLSRRALKKRLLGILSTSDVLSVCTVLLLCAPARALGGTCEGGPDWQQRPCAYWTQRIADAQRIASQSDGSAEQLSGRPGVHYAPEGSGPGQAGYHQQAAAAARNAIRKYQVCYDACVGLNGGGGSAGSLDRQGDSISSSFDRFLEDSKSKSESGHAKARESLGAVRDELTNRSAYEKRAENRVLGDEFSDVDLEGLESESPTDSQEAERERIVSEDGEVPSSVYGRVYRSPRN